MPNLKYKQKVRFAQTATATLASSTTETTLVSTGVGSVSLTKNSIAVGKTFKVSGAGVFSNTGTPTLDLKVKLGSVTVLDSGAITTVTTASNREFLFSGIITIRSIGASGTAFAQGTFTETLATGVSLNYPMSNAATVAVDTTANLAFNVTAQWGASSASNTISLTNLLIEELN